MAYTTYLGMRSGYCSNEAGWSVSTGTMINGTSGTYHNYYGMCFLKTAAGGASDGFADIRTKNATYFAKSFRIVIKSHTSGTNIGRFALGDVASGWNVFTNGMKPTLIGRQVDYSFAGAVLGTINFNTLTDLQALVNANTLVFYCNIGDDSANYVEFDGVQQGATPPEFEVDWYPRPTAPTTCTLSPSIYETNSITVTWSGAGGTINRYRFEYSTDGSTWNACTGTGLSSGYLTSTATSGSQVITSVNTTRGGLTYIRMRAEALQVGTTYVVSAYKSASATVKKNQQPGNAVIVWPAVAGAKIYNATPRIGITLGGEPDNQTMGASVGNGSASTQGYGTHPEYWSRQGYVAEGGNLVQKGLSFAAGAYTVNAFCNDGMTDSAAAVTRTMNVVTPTYTDPTLVAGVDVKGEHVRELRTIINDIRAYYGLAAKEWAETITDGTTEIAASHITEMRAALEEVRTTINAFDGGSSTFDIAAFTWTDAVLAAGGDIKAVHITEIRNVIPTL